MPSLRQWLERKKPHKHRKGLKRARLRPRSERKTNEHSLYICGLLFLLSLNPMCRLCGMRRATEGHHPVSQQGWLILLFIPACRSCHDDIHEHPKAAREVGLLF